MHLYSNFPLLKWMEMKRILPICLAACVLSSALLGQPLERPNYHKVSILSSWITIHGETNINNFHCNLNKSTDKGNILVKNVWSNDKLDFEGFELSYEVADFECGLQAMNNDFQALLRAHEEPFLRLQLNSLFLNPDNENFETLDVDAEVVVAIAGMKRKIEVFQSQVKNHTSAHLTLMGRKELLMSDFNIEAPTKFFGMVKVDDSIEIEFEISMEVSAYK